MKTEKQLLKEYIQYVLDSYKLNEALEVHNTLNPILWDDNQLKEDVKQSLLEVANHFIENLGFSIEVVDIRFLGSNASYNYNSQSDIDLHIITNFETNYIDDSILQQLYNNEKNSFNNKHDVKIKGIPVEIYIEDMKSMNATNGSYSLLQDKWVKVPKPINYEIPDYSKELDEELSKAQNVLSNATSSQEVKDEINHIYLMRKDGLAQDGEASTGNLVFKELRNMGIQSDLATKYYELESNELSLESEDLTESIKSNKDVLIELVRDADKTSLYYLVYNFGEIGFYREDKRRSAKKWLIDCINNCYKNEPTSQFDKTQNTEIENAVFNATHKDKEEYLNEMVFYKDVTPIELNNNPCKFIVINQNTDDRSENQFDNLKEVFAYIDQCGGLKGFKDLYWYIMSNYKDGEFYYVRDRFAKGGWHWEDCNGDIVTGTEFRKVRGLKEYDPGYGLSRTELISRLKKLGKNYNFDKFRTPQLYHIYNKEQLKQDELNKTPDEEFINSDEYKELMSQPKQKHVYYDAGYETDESNEAKDEIRKKYNESEQLNEYTLKDVLDDSKASDPKRIELSKSLYTEYKGVDSDGTLIFETDSQTRSNLGHRQRIFYEGFFDLLDKADQNEEITDEDVVNILTGDLMLDCSCESFLYWAWAYKSWKEEYGLKKETRAPKRNNVNLNGGACKHCLSVLELINRSDSIFDQIAKDLNDLFQHYKKQSVPNVEADPGDEQFARTAQNLAKKGKTNKKLKSNPKAAKYDIPKKEEPSGPINRLNDFNNEVMSDTK